MTSGKKGGLIGAVVCLVVAVVFVFVGLSERKLAAVCRTVEGQVTEVTKSTKLTHTGSGSHRRSKRKTVYHVTFTYNVDGQEYTEKTERSSSISVGPRTVYYDPADPGDGRLTKPSPWVAFIAAIVLGVVGVGIGFKTLTMGTG